MIQENRNCHRKERETANIGMFGKDPLWNRKTNDSENPVIIHLKECKELSSPDLLPD